jgi:predicted O-methyltransferase YrrM
MVTEIDISNALPIPGWMRDSELIWLANRAKECKVIVEFGCLFGRSTRALADNTDGIVYACDPWQKEYYKNNKTLGWAENVYPEFEANLIDHIRSEKVITVKNFSYNFPYPVEADMVFIDADHEYDSVIKDIEIARRMIGPNAIIAGHDYGEHDWPGVKKAVDDSFSHVNLDAGTIWWVKI